MKKLLLITSVTIIANLAFSQMRISRTKNSEIKIQQIENEVGLTKRRRDLVSTRDTVIKVIGESGEKLKLYNTAYWDKGKSKILLINQTILNAYRDIVSYYFKDESLIKVFRYRMIDNEPVLIGEYFYDNGLLLLEREREEDIDPKNILQEAKTLLHSAYNKASLLPLVP